MDEEHYYGLNNPLDEDDVAEMDRIESALMARGMRCRELTKIVRIALRVAFSDKNAEEVASICEAVSRKWKRGN